MSITLHTKTQTFEIGTSDFFRSFFDSIDYHLTRRFFDKKYPTILGEFQQGYLTFNNLDKAEKELRLSQKKLDKYNPSELIWDKYNLGKKPPWGDNISKDITSLSNYFVTSDGKDLFGVIYEAIEQAKLEQCDLKIE